MFCKKISYHEPLPKGYGVGYMAFNYDKCYCFPVPLNLIVWFCCGLWGWFKIPHFGKSCWQKLGIKRKKKRNIV